MKTPALRSTCLVCIILGVSAPAAAQDDEVFAVLPGVTLGAAVFHEELDSRGLSWAAR